MKKLLVDAPCGKQKVVEVAEGGGYFDSALVLWDERKDGPLPEITLGGMVRQDGALVFVQERMDSHAKAISETPKPRDPATALVDLLVAKKLITSEEAETLKRG